MTAVAIARSRLAAVAAVLSCMLTACTSDREAVEQRPIQVPRSYPAESSTADPSADAAGEPTPSTEPATAFHPISLPAYFDQEFTGGNLQVGEVRERTADFTSYDVSYRSQDLRITGVLNVPTGKGPFPAVVLAHGYIDPAIYVRGQGMTRERGYLAARGYVALHVDYRNHAESDNDPQAARHLRLDYSVDVINAVKALQQTDEVPVVDDQIMLMGRSMGGGVVYKALEMAPRLVTAAVAWAPVSSVETENYNRWIRGDATEGLDDYVARRFGLPGDHGSAEFWREISARTYFHRITEPVLIIQGGSDDTCPPRWARATHRALREAGVDARLAWYAEEEHAFGPQFFAAMDRAITFFEASNVSAG